MVLYFLIYLLIKWLLVYKVLLLLLLFYSIQSSSNHEISTCCEHLKKINKSNYLSTLSCFSSPSLI